MGLIDNANHKFLGKKLELHKGIDECASGEPKLTVVMVHGIASDSSTFGGAVRYLSGTTSLKDVRFVAFDLLGSGKSYTSDDLEYSFAEQVEALHNSIEQLEPKVPVVLVGHSMGTLIATRFASKYKRGIEKLVLLSPPIYTERDLDNPAMQKALDDFKKAVAVKDRRVVESKAFENSMQKVVLNRKNYQYLTNLDVDTVLIYGDADQIIASFNIPGVLKANPRISAIKTAGHHGVSREKYSKLVQILEKCVNGEGQRGNV